MYEKRASRGNVAVAALVFVTFVGVAAIALDSTRVAQNSRAQLAQAANSGCNANDNSGCSSATEKPKEVCINDDRLEITIGTKENSKPEIKPVLEHAKNKDGPQKKGCWVRFCAERTSDTQGNERPPVCTVERYFKDDASINSASVDRGEATKIFASEILKDYNAPENKYNGLNGLQGLPKSTSDAIGRVFTDDQGKLLSQYSDESNAAHEAEVRLAELERLRSGCYVDTCDVSAEDIARARADAEKKAADAAITQSRIEELSSARNVLAPDTSGCKSSNCVDAKSDPEDKRFQPPPTTLTQNPPGGNPPAGSPNSKTSGFNPSQLMQMLPALTSLLSSALQSGPSCTLKVSPESISQPGQPVTLSWTTQGAQQAYLSNVGQVGPSGSMQVQPQGATTYSMQVTGMTNTAQQQQTQYAYNPYTNTYMPVPAQQQQGTMQYGNCQVQVKVGTSSPSTANKPTAQISCQPKIADVGMSTAISFACQNSVASSGSGFSTNNELSGNRTVEVTRPTTGSTGNTFGLTCSKEGVTDSAQCTVNVNRPSIVLVATPQQVARNTQTSIGWITGAMESCVISSASLSAFTSENAGNTSASGVVKTPALSDDTEFTLSCTTKAGGSKTATITVDVQ